ncbi:MULTISPECIES: hypothetical protein [Listeria]|uniref:hypothetical protein n=1 Tax=Listeria TaxID=1637 RepID=UPI000B596E19|nr:MULTISPECIES: hypothetical protein [Listeria]
MKNCKYCKGEFSDFLMHSFTSDDNHLDNYFELDIIADELILRGDVRGRTKINYCPICGRKLEERAE